jgi:hypothetical protein
MRHTWKVKAHMHTRFDVKYYIEMENKAENLQKKTRCHGAITFFLDYIKN